MKCLFKKGANSKKGAKPRNHLEQFLYFAAYILIALIILVGALIFYEDVPKKVHLAIFIFVMILPPAVAVFYSKKLSNPPDGCEFSNSNTNELLCATTGQLLFGIILMCLISQEIVKEEFFPLVLSVLVISQYTTLFRLWPKIINDFLESKDK